MDDPTEREREYQRQYAAANAERKREAARQWRLANPERSRQSRRDYVQANYEAVREDAKRRYWANADEERAGRRLRNLRSLRHQLRNETRSRLWSEQGGRCYLCEEPIALDDSILEHDHRCCPPGDFCRFCVRGASCKPCNYAIGHADDDPARLERMARNLRAKLAEIDERLASKPEQLSLG